MDTVLKIADHIPWSLLVVALLVPYLKRQAKRIKSKEVRASYIDIVRFVEQTCEGQGSVVKKATALEKITDRGLPVNQVLLESIVHEVTGEARRPASLIDASAA